MCAYMCVCVCVCWSEYTWVWLRVLNILIVNLCDVLFSEVCAIPLIHSDERIISTIVTVGISLSSPLPPLSPSLSPTHHSLFPFLFISRLLSYVPQKRNGSEASLLFITDPRHLHQAVWISPTLPAHPVLFFSLSFSFSILFVSISLSNFFFSSSFLSFQPKSLFSSFSPSFFFLFHSLSLFTHLPTIDPWRSFYHLFRVFGVSQLLNIKSLSLLSSFSFHFFSPFFSLFFSSLLFSSLFFSSLLLFPSCPIISTLIYFLSRSLTFSHTQTHLSSFSPSLSLSSSPLSLSQSPLPSLSWTWRPCTISMATTLSFA